MGTDDSNEALSVYWGKEIGPDEMILVAIPELICGVVVLEPSRRSSGRSRAD